ncbi:MAG TPA: hypothetical protein DCS43_14580 [Verrucomicrobia bacterium]|nr:hypothetical protein [Verrucomicrobiota bacterium]
MSAFNLKSYLHTCGQLTGEALHRFLPSEEVPPCVLHQAMRYSVFAGGKRIRPAFVLATADCLGLPHGGAIHAAAAIEMLHTYTLIHDDLPCMDDDDFRRGRPSCHKQFGEANALLAGDALLTLAFETAASAPAAPASLVRTLAAAAGSRGVVGGQVADLAAAGTPADVDTILFIHEHKTADLFRAAVEMGALAAGATPDTLAALSRFGRATGLAFQIVDDLLDAENPADTSFSCIHTLGIDSAKARAAELTNEAMRALDGFGSSAEALRQAARYLLERTT